MNHNVNYVKVIGNIEEIKDKIFFLVILIRALLMLIILLIVD